MKHELHQAATLALAGEWDKAHEIAQAYSDPLACWIHAVLHKMEGDEWNSRYWYARAKRQYEDFPDIEAELQHILAVLAE